MPNQKLYNGRVVQIGTTTFAIAKNSIAESDVPAVGDTVVRIGNATNTDRQGALYLTSSDDGAPYMDVLDGVTSPDFTDKTVVRIGRLDGIADPIFGKLIGYGGYFSNIYARGIFKLADGSDVQQRFELGEGNLISEIARVEGSVDGKVSELETLIYQSDNSIQLEALQSDYNALGQRVGLAEAQVVIQAGEIASKVSATDFDTLTGRVTTAESSITQQAGLIEAKVSDGDLVTLINARAGELVLSSAEISLIGRITTSSLDSALQAEINDKVTAAELTASMETAEAYALAKANLAEVTANAYADNQVTAAEQRSIDDAQQKADAAQAAAIAASDALGSAAAAQLAAETNAEAAITTAMSALGAFAYQSSVRAALESETIIEGGYIKNSLIETEALLVGKFGENLAICSNASKSYTEDDGEYCFAKYDIYGGDIELNEYYTLVFDMEKESGSFYTSTMVYIGENHKVYQTDDDNSYARQIRTVTFKVTNAYWRDEVRFYQTDEEGVGHPMPQVSATIHWCALYKGQVAASETEWRASQIEAGGVVLVKDGQINADALVAKVIVTSEDGQRIAINESGGNDLFFYNSANKKIIEFNDGSVESSDDDESTALLSSIVLRDNAGENEAYLSAGGIYIRKAANEIKKINETDGEVVASAIFRGEAHQGCIVAGLYAEGNNSHSTAESLAAYLNGDTYVRSLFGGLRIKKTSAPGAGHVANVITRRDCFILIDSSVSEDKMDLPALATNAALYGFTVYVKNITSTTVKVYPTSGSMYDDTTANTYADVGNGQLYMFTDVGGKWVFSKLT